MPGSLEMRRVADGTLVDPSTKGLGPSGDPDEWLISVRLSDRPSRAWGLAWQEHVDSLGGDLRKAVWEYQADERHIYLWATTEKAEGLIRELDAMLERTNARCAEIVAGVEVQRAQNAAQRDQVLEEAARLQRLLNDLEPE